MKPTKNSWTEEEVDAKLTEKYGDKAEAVKEAFLKAYPEKSACDAYYVAVSYQIFKNSYKAS